MLLVNLGPLEHGPQVGVRTQVQLLAFVVQKGQRLPVGSDSHRGHRAALEAAPHRVANVTPHLIWVKGAGQVRGIRQVSDIAKVTSVGGDHRCSRHLCGVNLALLSSNSRPEDSCALLGGGFMGV